MQEIQSILQRLRDTYVSEIPARLDEIEDLVMLIERKGYSPSGFNDLFRRVHSLKGSGGTHGVPVITAVCHPFEDFLSVVARSNDPGSAFGDVALVYVDLLRDATKQVAKGLTAFPEIEARLAALRIKAFTPLYSALVVDKAGSSVRFAEKTLTKYNCRMVQMADGYEALGRALREPFDLIVTSLETPNLNGSALIAAVKLSMGPNSQTGCILLTSNSQLKIPGLQPEFVLLKNATMARELDHAVGAILDKLKAAQV